MSAADSISAWIGGMKAGNSDAAQRLWNRYYSLLVRRAKQELMGRRCGHEEAEDAALSAFASFCEAASAGKFPDLEDSEGLWRLLVKITVDKAIQQRRRSKAQKRGGGREFAATDLAAADTARSLNWMAEVIGEEPTPEMIATTVEEYARLMGMLKNEEWRQIAVHRMEGYTVDEIATLLDCAERTVERRLNNIRRRWENEANSIWGDR